MSRADARWRAVARRFVAATHSGAVLQDNAIAILFFIGSALATVSQVELLDSPWQFVLSSASACIATLYSCVLVFALRAFWRRFATRYSILGMTLLFAGIGALRLEMLAWLNDMLGLNTMSDQWLRLVAGALQGFVWMAAAGMYYANRDRFIIARAEVLEEQARIESNAYHQSTFAAVLAGGLAEAVAKRVSQSVSHTRDLIIDALPLEDSREALRDVSKSLRRPSTTTSARCPGSCGMCHRPSRCASRCP